ncbi:MAG: ABC transporter permease subunit [Oligoflexia bacterium]|nr:ABC transporter permease subunit [Oligoflexia bacterium]
MKKITTIALKEYRGYFQGFTAYAIMALFMGLMSFMFMMIVEAYRRASFTGQKFDLAQTVFGSHFGNTNVVLLILIPALTMRLFSEEYKGRTMDLLLTAPITATEIVLGKFFAGLLIVWTMIALVALHPLALRAVGSFDAGPVLTSLIGLMLLSGVYVAIGLFASALTESIIVAFFTGLALSLFMWVVGWAGMGSESQVTQTVFNHLSISNHFSNFARGTIDTSAVVYYVSLIFLFCFLTHRVVESARWR